MCTDSVKQNSAPKKSTRSLPTSVRTIVRRYLYLFKRTSQTKPKIFCNILSYIHLEENRMIFWNIYRAINLNHSSIQVDPNLQQSRIVHLLKKLLKVIKIIKKIIKKTIKKVQKIWKIIKKIVKKVKKNCENNKENN